MSRWVSMYDQDGDFVGVERLRDEIPEWTKRDIEIAAIEAMVQAKVGEGRRGKREGRGESPSAPLTKGGEEGGEVLIVILVVLIAFGLVWLLGW